MWSNSQKLLIIHILFVLSALCGISRLSQAVGGDIIVNGKVVGHVEAQAVGGAGPVRVEARVNGVLVQVDGQTVTPTPAKQPTHDDPKISGLDTVSAISGDRIRGKVVGITPDGIASITADHFAGPVRMRRSNIATITLSLTPPQNAVGVDRVELTNKDIIAGKIITISPKAVTIKSSDIGEVSIQRNVIKSIHFSNPSAMAIISQFQYGIMRPWEKIRGNWKVENKELVAKMGTGRNRMRTTNTLAAPWNYDKSFTISIDMWSPYGAGYMLGLFTSDKKSPYGRGNTVRVQMNNTYYYITAVQGGRYQRLGNGQFVSMARHGGGGYTLYTISYDTETRKLLLWRGTKKVGSAILPQGMAVGKYVIVGGISCNSRLRKLDIRQGVHEPNSIDTAKPIEMTQVLFKNFDRVAVKSLVMPKGAKELTATLEFGEVPIPKNSVAHIIFGTERQEEPRLMKGDVLVETLLGRYTIQLEALTGKALIGKAKSLGNIHINRASILRIQFNIHR